MGQNEDQKGPEKHSQPIEPKKQRQHGGEITVFSKAMLDLLDIDTLPPNDL